MKKKVITILIILAISVLLLIGVVALYQLILFSAHNGNPDYNLIDRCLDNGGRWIYEQRSCEFTE